MGLIFEPREHYISVARTAIDGKFVAERNLWKGYGIWECVQQSTAWFIAPIHVAIRQFIHESWAIRPHIQVFLHVVPHCWPWHTKFWRSFPCRLRWGTFNGSDNRCTCFEARCLFPTPRPVFNTSKSERSFFPNQQCGGALLNPSRNAAIPWDMVYPVCSLSCTHTLATKRSGIEYLLVSAVRKTQLNSVAAVNHVCTILYTVAKLPFYIALRVV